MREPQGVTGPRNGHDAVLAAGDEGGLGLIHVSRDNPGQTVGRDRDAGLGEKNARRVAHPARQHRAQRGESQQHAGEARRGADARTHARAMSGNRAHDRLLCFAIEQATARAEHEHAPDQDRPVAYVRGERENEVPCGDDSETDGQHAMWRQSTPQPMPDAREKQHRHGEGQHPDTGGQRIRPTRVLKEQRKKRRHDLRRRGVREHGQHRADKRGGLKQRQVQHRMARTSLHGDERGDKHGAGHDTHHHGRTRPPRVRSTDQCPGKAEHRAREEGHAGKVERARCRIARFADRRQDGETQHQHDRRIDMERPRPADVAADHSADQGRHHHGESHDRAPGGPGARALRVIGEGMADDGERGRELERRAHALRGARDIEPARRWRQSARHRRDPEQRQSEQEHPFTPEAIRDGARR